MADEFPVNTTTTGDQDQPGVAGLQGTQFITVWRDASTQDIKGRLFGVDGAASSGEFNVNFAASGRHEAAIADGHRDGSALPSHGSSNCRARKPQLKLRTFDADSLSGPGKPGEQRPRSNR